MGGLWSPLDIPDDVLSWPGHQESAGGAEEDLENIPEPETSQTRPESMPVIEDGQEWALIVKDGVFIWPDQTSGQNLTLGHVAIPKGTVFNQNMLDFFVERPSRETCHLHCLILTAY